MNTFAFQDLPDLFHSQVTPTPAPDVAPIALNTAWAEALGLGKDWPGSTEGLAVLSGQSVLGANQAIAMAYGGHQFGQWAGLLGDGRARLVGEVIDKDGGLHELHLKGAGPTPYARRGDGKATLGAAIREYVVSEAMGALGVPTTRALSVVTTGEDVFRNGPEPGAIICRTARSHIRVGTFQLAAASDEIDNVRALADFAIARLYPEIPEQGPDKYRAFYRAVIARQAKLIASWMGFGFIHGVMNTDNMCVSGETIDYGPCAYMDAFHPGKVFSSIDRRGRYAWGRQPEMAHWNLARLAECLLPLFGDDDETGQKAAEEELGTFVGLFQNAFNTVLGLKFGLKDAPVAGDEFIKASIEAMTEGTVDFTRFFTALTRMAAGGSEAPVLELFEDREIGEKWLSNWKDKTGFKKKLDESRLKKMKAANPVRIARNHRVEQAIADANAGKYETFNRLVDALKTPFEESDEFADLEDAPTAQEEVTQTFCGT